MKIILKIIAKVMLNLLHFIIYFILLLVDIIISILYFIWSLEFKKVTRLTFYRRRPDGIIVFLSPIIYSAYKTPFHILLNKTTIPPL